MTDPVVNDRPPIEPSTLGQFIALDGCPQFFKYEFDDELAEQRRNEKSWKEAFEPLSLLLAKEGLDYEERVVGALEEQAHSVVSHGHIEEWEASTRVLEHAFDNANELPAGEAPVLITQPRFGMQIEAWPVVGDADIVAIWSTDTGIRIRILEIKAAHEEKTYQQVQVAMYTLLCRQFLENLNPDYDWTIEGGIIHRETDITGTRPEDFPRFSLRSRELDVRRILQPDGQFDELWSQNPANVRYQLAPKCYNCAYKESCFTDSIENQKPALLGLSRGEQQTLADHGVETIEDLASLAYPPSDPRPYEYTELTSPQESKYEALVSEPGIGERLPQYIQEAQSLLSEIYPDHMYTPNTDSRAPWLLGSGNGELPEDDPAFDDEHLSIPRRSMIRCYFHVEWDHRRDRVVMVSAYITATRYTEDEGETPQEVTHLVNQIPEGEDGESVEAELLESVFSEVFAAIQTVANEMDGVSVEEAPVHWYFYSLDEREAIVDAIERYPDNSVIRAAQDVFGLRSSIDQSMVSIVQSEIQERLALPVNNPGILPVKEYLSPSQSFFAQSDWTYTRTDGTEINLRNAFRHRLFDFYVPYVVGESGITLYPADEPDGYYPSRARQGSHIPLEYIWTALGRMTEAWVEEIQEEYDSYQSIDPFKWIDRDRQQTRIVEEDVKALSIRLAKCLAHIERGITYRNANIPKEPLDLTELPDFDLGENSLARASIEYLQLEYSSQRQELLTHYGLPVEQRIRRGESIPVVVESAFENEQGDLVVDGILPYDRMFDDGDRVAGACRQKGATGETSGSWMVANELSTVGDPIESTKPRHIERGPGVTIQDLDIENRRIRLTAIDSYRYRDQTFQRRHRDWTVDPTEEDEETVCFEAERVFVLDPRSDDLTAQRSYNVLQEPTNNFVCQSLEALRSGRETSPTTDAFPAQPVEEFIEWVTSTYEPVPNSAQQAFIEEHSAQFALLQGPPGTGKTSGALANAVLARILSFDHRNEQCVGIVAGESNKAVNEVLEDVAAVYNAYQTDPETGDVLDRLQLIRLTGEPPDDPVPSVEYLDYHDDDKALRALVTRLQDADVTAQQTLQSVGQSGGQPPLPHVLVFTTPARFYGLMNNLDTTSEESLSPREWVASNASFFDLLAIDEASMMRLPSFLLTGAFLHDHAQVLITGDQRQLPPVQQHDWEAERRRTITELAPYLSTLDYFRALNGESVIGLEENTIIDGSAAVPFYRLEETYRCHSDVANVLHRHVYAKDGINFHSAQSQTLRDPTPTTRGEEVALDPADPLVLIVHEDRASQQSNIPEALLSASLVEAVTDIDETGIVTPHNAQRGVLSELTDSTEVDTVERFQGGERDCIVVSATASDPDFLQSERDFILNPNRLNVAMSRMKRKLVVIASESVFELMPPDTEKYERAGLWKGLYEELEVIDTDPAWTGTIDELTSRATLNLNTNPGVSIYTFNPVD